MGGVGGALGFTSACAGQVAVPVCNGEGVVSVAGSTAGVNVAGLDGHAAHAGHVPPTGTGNALIDFFTGDGEYMSRVHCMVTQEGKTDWFWVIAMAALTMGVVVAYARIFVFWMRCYFAETPADRNKKLYDLGMVFLWCAICGYALSAVMFFWPGYRLMTIALVVLNFFSWRFCIKLQTFAISFQAPRLERQLREQAQQQRDELERELMVRTVALRQSETKYRSMVQNLPGVAFRVAVDEKWTNLFVSDGIEEMTGYPASDFINNAVRDCASITHPDDVARVDEAVRVAIETRSAYAVEYRVMRRDGAMRWVLERGMIVCDEVSGQPAFIDGLQFDITERKCAEQLLEQETLSDGLTGLANRNLLMHRLRRCVEESRRGGRQYALLFLDFDRFKVVNDSLGHEAGDELLRQIARRVREFVKPMANLSSDGGGKLACRLGGDEFVVLLDDVREHDEPMRVARELLDTLREPYQVGVHSLRSTASIGVVTSQRSNEDAETVLRDADTAMYRAKQAGKGCAVMFDASMRSELQERVQLEAELRLAVERGELSVVYQPIVSLEDGVCRSVEALVRWHNPRRGNVTPTEFIPIAEDAGLIVPIGEWVLGQALDAIKVLDAELGEKSITRVSVNLSRAQLTCEDLVERVSRAARERGVAMKRLQLEVTEHQVMSGTAERIDLLMRLRMLGATIAMDDFGTGLSSLSALHTLPIDVLKIDRGFVKNLGHGTQFMALARSVMELAANLGMKTVAEGIETAEQLAALQALECNDGQGFYFAKPLLMPDLIEKLRGGAKREQRAAA